MDAPPGPSLEEPRPARPARAASVAPAERRGDQLITFAHRSGNDFGERPVADARPDRHRNGPPVLQHPHGFFVRCRGRTDFTTGLDGARRAPGLACRAPAGPPPPPPPLPR